MAEPLVHVDLFSGPGGFGRGLKAAGWVTAVAVEKVATCVQTYRLNFPSVPVIGRDIREVTGGEVAGHLPMCGNRRRDADLVTAGFPCEANSTAGTRSRNTYDHRLWLYRDAIRIARMVRARAVLFENVVPIRTKRASEGGPGLLIDEIRRDLANAGYANSRECVLTASDFGVPQRRVRWFLIATREPLDIFLPDPPGVLTTVRDAFADLPPDLGRGGHTGGASGYTRLMRDVDFWRSAVADVLTQHHGPTHRPATVTRNALVPPGGRAWDLYRRMDPDTLARLQALGAMPAVAFKQRGQRLHPARPSLTLTSHCEGELVHPTRNRCLSVREAARLQSFPDCHVFTGPTCTAHEAEAQDKYEQIGDAVPPLLAWSLGMSVRKTLTGEAEAVHPLSAECRKGDTVSG